MLEGWGHEGEGRFNGGNEVNLIEVGVFRNVDYMVILAAAACIVRLGKSW